MQVVATLFLLASIAVAISALWRNGPVRRWFRARTRPRRVLGLVMTAWLVVFITLAGIAGSKTDTVPVADSGNPTTSSRTTPTATTAPPTPTPSTTPNGTTRSNTTTRPPDMPAGVPTGAQRAIVKRIVDGDTLELAAVSTGSVLATTQRVDVRLLEIDTPETVDPDEPVQCYGAQAATRLAELAPVGSTVWIQRDEQLRDQYERYLLYLWNSQGVFVNLALVKGGYATAVLYEPNDRYWDVISSAKSEAKSARIGLWSACPYFGAPVDTPEPTSNPTPVPPENTGDSENNAHDPRGGFVFPAPPPDIDCGSVSAHDFRVRPGDPHNFDGDGDGIGCES